MELEFGSVVFELVSPVRHCCIAYLEYTVLLKKKNLLTAAFSVQLIRQVNF